MEKKCFIIMPLSEQDGYAKGHFNRVYQYILVPACRLAGFSPIRVGDPSISESPLDIINTMIESDIVICDLSANDSHALYGFAIRQATGLPVTLIKDLKTNVSANIPEYAKVEYDDSLRIDTVQNEIETLSEALKKAYDDKGESNPLLSQLNIGSARVPELNIPAYTVYTIDSSAEPSQEGGEEEEKAAPLPIISPLPDYVGEPLTQHDIDRLKVGDFFFHMNYGKGEILTINKQTRNLLVKVYFESGAKIFVLHPSDIFRKIKG
jgi:hypothetical protein